MVVVRTAADEEELLTLRCEACLCLCRVAAKLSSRQVIEKRHS